ncbi:LamG-like jellyroll fold domain-containing protein [Rufibacter soli]
MLNSNLLSGRVFSNPTQADTVIRPYSIGENYTLEVVAKVNSATGRGLDLEARNAKAQGFRLSLDASTLKWTSALTSASQLATASAGKNQTIRVAVQNGAAHIYQNGVFLQTQPVATIRDLVGGVEAGLPTVGSTLIPNWAGIAPNNTGRPSDYGWAYTGSSNTTLFNTANSTSGVRYIDVNQTTNRHTLDGQTYFGRVMFIRWDSEATRNTVYSYPVTLEANTTYNFSLLHAYWSNSTGGTSMRVGIGKTTSAADRLASQVLNTTGTATLKRDNFVFTSQEAGKYYLTFTGDWGLFTISDLAVKKLDASPRFLFGKNYPNGEVNMEISSATYAEGAYAPELSLNPGDPVEMTQSIVNPSFENSTTGWTNNGLFTQTNTSFGTFKNGTTYLERWVSAAPLPDVTISQMVTGLPNGNYTLTVAAHHLQASTGKPGAFVFAKDAQTQVTDRKDYAVNFMVLDGSATIGFKTLGSQGNWAAIDNFRLVYTGFSVASMKTTLQTLKDSASVLLGEKMQNPVRAGLISASTSADQAITNATIGEEIADVVLQLQKAIGAANASIGAYSELQAVIDNATGVLGDGSGKDANLLLAIVQKNQTLANNLDATSAELKNGVTEVNGAVFAYRLANATGPAPVVTTNPNFARGATMAFGRSTISVPVGDLLEHGFCWSTNPEPTIADNRTTKYFSNNGFIYRLEDLQPGTVYYMRAYAISKTYTVGYGDVLKVVTIPKGTVTYQLNASVLNSGANHPRIAAAMESAVSYFNNLTSIQGHRLSVNYNAGTPTAEASYGGYMQFGANASYQRTGTALHEMGHTIGVGQHSMWYGPNSPLRAEGTRGTWLGERANKVVQFLENNPTEVMKGDAVHMWPYGINGANEDTGSELLYIGNALIHQALGEDGLPPTGGFATPSYTFKSKDGEKYYIKSRDEKMGLGAAFLVEDAAGQLINKAVKPSVALASDSAAWYIKFVPATGYYQIQNAATGHYFTYQATGVNGIKLTSVATPASSNAFQLLGVRYKTEIGEEGDAFTAEAFSILRPEAKLNPLCLAATDNTSTSAVAFINRNDATAQHWLLLSQAEVTLYKNLVEKVPTVVKNLRISAGDSKVTLTWDLKYNARYDVLRSEAETGAYTAVATDLEEPRFVDQNSQNGFTYFYKVVAHNEEGRSPESVVLSGSPLPGHHLRISFEENSGSKAYDAWGGYHAALKDGATWAAGQNNGSAVNLVKATGSFLQLEEGVVSELNDFTIAAWVKLPSNQGNNTRLFDFGSGTGTYMMFVPRNDATTVRYKIIRSDNGKNYDKIIPCVIPLNQWAHVTLSQQGSTFKLYLNGQVVFTDSTANVKPSDLGITASNYLGKSQWATDPYSDQAYDDFRIYNHAITASQVQELFENKELRVAQKLTFQPLAPKLVGDAAFDAGATASSRLTVNYASSNPAVAVVENGLIQVVGAGETTITASQAGNDIYAPAEDLTQDLVVSKREQTITFTSSTTRSFGETDFVAATVSSELPLSFSSSNTAVATIVNGKVHLVGVGTTVISATQPGNEKYLPAAAVSQEFLVVDTTPPSIPTSLTSLKKERRAVELIWQASTDDVGVTGYDVFLNGAKVNAALVIGTSFTTEYPLGNDTYIFTLKARDAAGNWSGASENDVVTNRNAFGNASDENEAVIIFPNPSQGDFQVRISSAQMGSVSIQIYDNLGNLVTNVSETKNTLQYQKSFRLQTVKKGIYSVKVQVGSFVSTKSLVLE